MVDLSRPLAWKDSNAEEFQMLRSLQGNILKGHGRDHVALLFFEINEKKPPLKSRRALREIGNFHITDALEQLIDNEFFKTEHEDGGPFTHLALTSAGYAALDLADAAPQCPIFRQGMLAGADTLNDDTENWENEFCMQLHGVILAADSTAEGRDCLVERLTEVLGKGGIAIRKSQLGGSLKNKAGIGLEHFGYVDGRSQPLMLEEDITEETESTGTARWDPRFPLSTALVRDPGVDDDVSYGSFFVFRKLEQNVRGFKRREQEIADLLQLAPEKRELAGALIVGRFEDGTPVTMSDKARGGPVSNDFNYVSDDGRRCPMHAHIRKVNPRTTLAAEGASVERSRIMPRRGIPYQNVPRVHPDDLPEIESMDDFKNEVERFLPTGDVGLLFMAYNSDLAGQFVFTQKMWANNKDFPGREIGIDPVIGQAPDAAIGVQSLRKAWDQPEPLIDDGVKFHGFVTSRGGEYFFSPSMTFLKQL